MHTTPDDRVPYSALRVTVRGAVVHVVLNRPEQHNAVDQHTGRDLARLSAELADDPAARAVLLTAEGDTFSAGGDIAMFAGIPPHERPARIRALVDTLHPAIDRITALDVPVVAGVRGAVAGAGLGLVCAADVVVAAQDAVFVVGYPGIGLTADTGVSWMLPRLVGMRRAQEMFLLGRRVSGDQALEWGLVTALVPADEVDTEAERLATRLAAGPTAAFAGVRRLLRDGHERSLREHLDAEADSVVAAAGSADFHEGVTAFVQRRPPRFTGD